MAELKDGAGARADGAGLYGALRKYSETDAVPFHMPGHKRNERFSFADPFTIDITEIDGFDDLHHPEGILREAMDRAAAVYGTDNTFFLVNGSSCGILAALSACPKKGGKILLARDSHKSAYNAVLLRELDPVYLYPEPVEGWGISGPVDAEAVDKALAENADIDTVFITSPTYEGVCSDIRRIAEAAHEHGAVLIVDAAHGAHLTFSGEGFPASALFQGADVVIESLHKTLPSLTQTALLHVKGQAACAQDIMKYLQIYESSSPSYVLMASIDECVRFMSGESGRECMRQYEKDLRALRSGIGRIKGIRLLAENDIGAGDLLLDPSKLVIAADGLSGTELYEGLRTGFNIQPEMCTDGYVVLLTSPGDKKEWYERLLKALAELARENEGHTEDPAGLSAAHVRTERVMTMARAERAPQEMVSLGEACGRTAAEALYIYPPGTPLVVPGEMINGEVLNVIRGYMESGLFVHGVHDGFVCVIKE